jgi:hypothetical protein
MFGNVKADEYTSVQCVFSFMSRMRCYVCIKHIIFFSLGTDYSAVYFKGGKSCQKYIKITQSPWEIILNWYSSQIKLENIYPFNGDNQIYILSKFCHML